MYDKTGGLATEIKTTGSLPSVLLLGTVSISHGGTTTPIGRPRARALLAVLALRSGRSVSRAELVQAVWGDKPPRTAVGNVQTYISGIRKVLSSDSSDSPLRTTNDGYLLAIPPSNVDVLQVEALVRGASTAFRDGKPDTCATMLAAAIELWRGNPLAGASGPFAESERLRLTGLLLSAQRMRVKGLLASNRFADAVLEAGDLVMANPLDEDLAAMLSRGLFHCGRVEEALAELNGIRNRLRQELGIKPGKSIDELYQSILSGNSRSTQPPSNRTAPAYTQLARPVRPAQLPHRPWGFVGRPAELEELRNAMLPGKDPVLVTGLPGTGKSALALESAHSLRREITGGQLYLSVRELRNGGHEPSPSDLLDYFLHTLGLREEQIPDGIEGKAERLSRKISQSRLLVVIDDVDDAEQVRPLLSAVTGHSVLITSRLRMTALPAVETITLGALTEAEAVEMLLPDDEAPETSALRDARKLAKTCARVPLSLRMVAAEFREGAETPGIGDSVRFEKVALEGEFSVRSALSESIMSLTDESRLLLNHLASNLDRWSDVKSLARATSLSIPDTEAALAPLDETNMLETAGSSTFRMNEIVRVHGAGVLDAPTMRKAVQGR